MVTYLTRERECERQHIYEEILCQVVVLQPALARVISLTIRHVEYTHLSKPTQRSAALPSLFVK
jgi:hypothetical protein